MSISRFDVQEPRSIHAFDGPDFMRIRALRFGIGERSKPKGPLRTEIRPFVAPASALALDNATPIELAPEIEIRVSAIVPFLVMKAKAFAHRAPKKTKDAYDIYFCVKHYPGGVESIADAFRSMRRDPLVEEAIAILARGFESPTARGCLDVSEFLDDEEVDILRRDVFERMHALLERITNDRG